MAEKSQIEEIKRANLHKNGDIGERVQGGCSSICGPDPQIECSLHGWIHSFVVQRILDKDSSCVGVNGEVVEWVSTINGEGDHTVWRQIRICSLCHWKTSALSRVHRSIFLKNFKRRRGITSMSRALSNLAAFSDTNPS